MRRCFLFFHGRRGTTPPVALGNLGVERLAEAIDLMQQQPDMPAHPELAGQWCCSFAEVDDAGPHHPDTCQYRFKLSSRGKISAATIVQ